MDFFNSLSQIAKNKNNFKKWEENQNNEFVQREELYNRHQYSDEELAKAKALGEKIIDVVDIMDNHSESVAENVETATQPLVAMAPWIGLIGSGAGIYKFVLKPNFKKIDKYRDGIINNEKAIDLCKKIEEHSYKNGDKIWFSPWNLTDKKSIKKIKDSKLRSEAMEFYKKYEKDIAKYVRKNKLGYIGIGVATLLSFIGINIYAAKLQVDSSKIARYQARESLKDPKAFVTYTPEQIEAAKEEIAKHPEWKKIKKKEKLKTGLFKSIINLFKDRKAYLKSVKNDKDESKIITRDLTPEEIENAKKDKEVIQRTIRIINNEAEKYSQRMEVAGDVIINGTPFLGAAIGGGLAWIFNKTGIIEKYVDKQIQKNGSEKTKELYASLKKGKESGNPIIAKWKKFSESYVNDLENANSKISETTKETARVGRKKSKDFVPKLKALFTSGLAHKKGRGWIIAGIGSIVTGIAGALIGLKLQKSASRAGRYTAKRELEKDPKNFIGFTEQDYDGVKDVKSTKKKTSTVKETIMFLPKVIKQYIAYNKFKKKEFKDKQLLQEQLQKQEVSEEQLKQAKNLQRKLFNTFEKVDDNSQTYSEATEAAIDITKPFIAYGGILAAISPIIYFGIKSPAKMLKKLTSLLSKFSNQFKSKWFKKYLGNVEKNISTQVQNTYVNSKPIGKILEGVDLKNDPLLTILSKSWKNITNTTEQFGKMSNEEQIKVLYHLEDSITKLLKIKYPKSANKVSEIINSTIWKTDNPQLRADALNIIFNPSSVKSMTNERYNAAYSFVKNIIKKNVGSSKSSENLCSLISEMACSIDTKAIKNLSELIEQTPELKSVLKPEELNTFIDSVEKLQNSQHSINTEDIIDKILTQKNITSVINTTEKIKNTLSNSKQLLKDNPELLSLLKTIKSYEAIPLSPEIAELMSKLSVKIPEGKETLTIKELLQTIKAIKIKITNTRLEDLKSLIPQESRNPKIILNNFKQHINKMSEDEFSILAENIHISSMDKKTMLEILPKVEKILDNIPKEELTKIWNKVVEEFNAHPDEFLKLLNSGKIGTIFMTPGLKKTLAAVGISWILFTTAITYAISSWLGELQLKAGRLGVMKAIEGLDDYRYYANIEPTQTVKTEQEKVSEIKNSNMEQDGNLLAKFKK